MEFCIEKELDAKILHCPQCKSTGVLVGLKQIRSKICVDCLMKNETSREKTKFDESWIKVRPVNENYPSAVESGRERELPILTPGENAVIAVAHPVVTVAKNVIANKKFRRESFFLLEDYQKTWSKFLPRKSL